MYSCTVGTDFKVGFFKRFLNFCYVKEEGKVYSDDIEVLKKLGLDQIQNQEEKEIKTEIVYENLDLKKRIESLENKFEFLKNKQTKLEENSKEIINIQQEFLDDSLSSEEKALNTIEILKSSIGELNKKIKKTNEEVNSSTQRLEAVLELISEHAARSGQLPNISKGNFTLEKIWATVQDKNSAAILSIMLMLKKVIESKGTRL